MPCKIEPCVYIYTAIEYPMITYVGIGSCPHTTTLSELTDEWDQILPMFIRGLTAKIFHYDPEFERRQEFMKEYFEANGFTMVDPFHWSKDTMEVTLYPKRFEHPDDDHLLEELAEEAIRTNTKLVVQEFTGGSLTELLKATYKKTSSKVNFKRNVLFDITYGTECHCMTNMVKYRPIYDNKGDFVNFLLYDESEIINNIGLSPELNDLIKEYFVKKYLSIVNQQVDYRRRLTGDTVFFACEGYGDTSTPDEIMAYLQRKMIPILDIFDSLGMMTPQKWGITWNLFEMYRSYNIYDWNTTMAKMVN